MQPERLVASVLLCKRRSRVLWSVELGSEALTLEDGSVLFELCFDVVGDEGDVSPIGFINIPIVKFSVDIWYSLHQSASVLRINGPSIHHSMLLPLLIMFFSFIVYFIITLIMRSRIIINQINLDNKKTNHDLRCN